LFTGGIGLAACPGPDRTGSGRGPVPVPVLQLTSTITELATIMFVTHRVLIAAGVCHYWLHSGSGHRSLRRNEVRPRIMARLVIVALTIVLLGVAAGLAAALVLPKTYGARAEILYSVGQDPQGDPLKQDRELSTQLVYLTSRAVLGPVAQKQGREFDDLARDVSVQVLNNSEVIEVEADGATRQAALQTLQAVVTGYMMLISQPTGVSRNLHNQLADAHANTLALQKRVQELIPAVLAGTATQTSLDNVRAQVTASSELEKALQTKIDELDLTGQQGPGAQILTQPYALPDPVFPQPLTAAGLGGLVGLIAAGAAVGIAVRREPLSRV
jgi:uncharacterized protein involved in exopolysaccharide biosynthesis